MKCARDDPIYRLLNLEAMVGDNDEEDQENQEDNDGASAGIPDYSIPVTVAIIRWFHRRWKANRQNLGSRRLARFGCLP